MTGKRPEYLDQAGMTQTIDGVLLTCKQIITVR